MKPKFFLSTIMLVVLTAMNSSAQKLSPASRMLIAQQKNALLAKNNVAKNTESVLTSILLEKGCDVSDETLSEYGVRVEKRRGRLILAYVPINSLESLTAIEGIRSIDTGRKSKPYNDIARETTSVVFVHDKDIEQDNPSAADIPTKYRGKDVFVGIIDSEIDFGHPAFRDAKGKSRIKKAHYAFNTPSGDYVENYDENNIEDGVMDRMWELVFTGHGTHVAGIAVGSTALLPEDEPMKKFYGIAPEADILAFDEEYLTDNTVLFALSEALDKAEEDQRPLVVNMSCGVTSTVLDGSENINEGMSALLEAYNPAGKIVCVSSGNDGDRTITAQIECDKPIVDGEWTLQKKLACPIEKNWENTAEFCGADDKEFAVQYEFRYIPKNGEHQTIATSPIFTRDNFKENVGNYGAWRDKKTIAEGDTAVVFVIPDFYQSPSGRMMHWKSSGTNRDSVYVVLNFYTKEEGVSIDALSLNLPFMTMEDAEYAIPNNHGCLNVYACIDNVISVGSYNTRTKFNDMNDKEWADPTCGKDGGLSLFSGYCTPHYGTPRPDVVAPGAYIVSAMHHNKKDAIVMGKTPHKGMDYLWAASSGTSMAAPVVTGIIALWLQADPTLTVEDVREIIAKTSDFDEECTANPYQAGHGKINALRGLEYILSLNGINDVSADKRSATAKFLDKDNKLIIRRGNHLYDATGRRIMSSK